MELADRLTRCDQIRDMIFDHCHKDGFGSGKSVARRCHQPRKHPSRWCASETALIGLLGKAPTLRPLRYDTALPNKAFVAHFTPERRGIAGTSLPPIIHPWQPGIKGAGPSAEYIQTLTAQHIAYELAAVPRLSNDLPDGGPIL